MFEVCVEGFGVQIQLCLSSFSTECQCVLQDCFGFRSSCLSSWCTECWMVLKDVLSGLRFRSWLSLSSLSTEHWVVVKDV